ncbi:hypothetical protein DYQ86_15495 [Acidobacteria bacterium AB60]|nr:hypothetical protein DYQ86_15495 [Acidobacteria bacterium AB60]
MRDSTWAFAIVEIGHLLALAVFGGAVLLVDLRFLGFGLRGQSASKVAKELLPLAVSSIGVMLLTGFLMVANGPVRYYFNPAFRFKMILFVIALFFHFVLQIAAARNRQARESLPFRWKAAATISLILWLSIGIAGRAIGYV